MKAESRRAASIYAHQPRIESKVITQEGRTSFGPRNNNKQQSRRRQMDGLRYYDTTRYNKDVVIRHFSEMRSGRRSILRNKALFMSLLRILMSFYYPLGM
jgi:hypothetical protein